jgi:hypothetical protein
LCGFGIIHVYNVTIDKYKLVLPDYPIDVLYKKPPHRILPSDWPACRGESTMMSRHCLLTDVTDEGTGTCSANVILRVRADV